MSEVRLDKYLWAVRVFKTRSDAADAIRNNRVLVNNAYAKPSRASPEAPRREYYSLCFLPSYRGYKKKHPETIVAGYLI